MHRKLLELAYKKAEEDTADKSIVGLSKYLSDKVSEISNQPYGENALRTKYRIVKSKSDEDIKIRGFAADALSLYLGYDSFIDFLKVNSKSDTLIRSKLKSHWLLISVVVILLFSFVLYNWTTRERWMVWEKTMYVETNFNTDLLKANKLKLYNQERIDNFERVIINCETEIFNADKTPKFWYGKNSNNNYDYFTSLGIHPETGKTLKPISKYIHQKHVCN